MATTSIIVNSTNSGKVLQKTITNVNPDAANDKLAAWGQMLTALTDNTYTKTDRVDKANCDTESGKQTATITLGKTTDTLANVKQDGVNNAGYIIHFTFTGNAVPQVYTSTNAKFGGYIEQYQGTYTARLLSNAISDPTNPFTVTIVLPETDTYKAAEATFTVTA